MQDHHTTSIIIRSLFILLLASPTVILAQNTDPARPTEPSAEYRAMLEDAERARTEAEQARREATVAAERAREVALKEERLAREEAAQQRERSELQQAEAMKLRARERELQRAERERVRDELGRAHRELRQASREIAEAHRALARSSLEHQAIRQINLGERVVIGVVLGRGTDQGVEIIGVSPGGPAERAGLQAGDVLISIGGESLVGGAMAGENKGRETLFRAMDETEAGAVLAVQARRDGKILDFEVTAERREPSSWQALIRIPAAPAAPDAPHAPTAVVERIEIPDIDEEAINEHIQALDHELQAKRFVFVSPDGKELDVTEEFVLPDGLDAEIAGLSELAGHALREANVWFGLPQAQGLELAAINEGLGSYFKTDRGVLVLRAREENAYKLQSGDVVLEINSRKVDSPTDLMRALREIEPGSEIEIAIKRDRKDRTLSAVMPENRLGYAGPVHSHFEHKR